MRVSRTRSSVLLVTLLFLSVGCVQSSGSPRQETPAILTAKEIEARLSQPIYKTIQHEEATIEGANGTKLWIDVFRPQDAKEKVPVILVATPYRILADTMNTQCTSTQRDTCAYDQELTDYFAPRGYALAYLDARGNHNSGGCADLLGPESWKDGYNAVEWLASREWSNGRVAMYGGSYDGSTAIGTAILDPPHLVTIMPGSAVTSLYAAYFYDGVPYFLGGTSSASAYLAVSALPGQDPNVISKYPERLECQPQNLKKGADQSGDWDPYWEAREMRALASHIHASVLEDQGLRDDAVRPDQVVGFWDNVTSEKRLILGQWGHQPPARKDWTVIRHRWLDYYLKGIDTGLLQDLPHVLIQDTARAWRGMDNFPPPLASTRTYYLSANGSLDRYPAMNGTLMLQDYPRASFEDPVGGVVASPGELATGHPRKLVFTTAPLDQDLHIVGSPFIHLVASTNAKSTHWAVRIIDADAKPESGRDDDNGALILNRGFGDARHRFGIRNPQDLFPGEAYFATIRLYPHDDVIPKGHRLQVVLNNNDNYVQQDTTFATSTVRLGGPDGTRIVLPLAAAGVPVPADALRPGLGG